MASARFSASLNRSSPPPSLAAPAPARIFPIAGSSSGLLYMDNTDPPPFVSCSIPRRPCSSSDIPNCGFFLWAAVHGQHRSSPLCLMLHPSPPLLQLGYSQLRVLPLGCCTWTTP